MRKPLAKRLFALYCAAALFACAGRTAALAEPPQTGARAAMLIDRASGRVLYELDADAPRAIASTTKIMTALLTLEHCSLSETVTAGENASRVPGTSIYLGVGEQLSVYQMLEGLLLRSGNDAAVALAEHVAGDARAFADMMNARAEELGANARFVNPHGLDAPGHEASARGLALIADEAMDFPVFREIVSMKRAVLPWAGSQYDRVLTNKNKLLETYPGATGVKTGYTAKAGRCLVFAAEREGMELLGVLLHCGTWFEDAKHLLDWGFDTYQSKTFLARGAVVGSVAVEGGMEDRVMAFAQTPLTVPIAEGEKAELIIELERRLPAPVRAGTVIGCAELVVDGFVVCARPLFALETVEERSFAKALQKLLRRYNPAA